MKENDLLRCLVHLVGRAVLPPQQVAEVIGSGKKHIKAFNLCDGAHTIKEIARKTKLDSGNLSRTTSRWFQNGIVFWVGEGQDARLLHVYPISETKRRRAERK